MYIYMHTFICVWFMCIYILYIHIHVYTHIFLTIELG